MPELLLAVSDYPGIPLDRRTVVLAVTLAAFLVVLPLAAWWAGVFDRSKGRHAVDRRPPPQWLLNRQAVAAVWVERNVKAQQELTDARKGGDRR